MRIDEVELKNIGPHQHFQHGLGSGLIGILGRNGAGKSTLINSIYAALTNDYSRFNAVKAEIISKNIPKTAKSFIRIVGSHKGQDFELTRWLRPNKAELSINGSVYTKANDINQVIEDQLGVPKLVIDKYVFVNQWEMFQFLNQTESERAKAFQYLCGTEVASRIHKVCQDYVTQQKGKEIVDNSLDLQEAIDAAQEQMDHHKAKGTAAKNKKLDSDTLKAQKAILKKAEKADEAVESLDQAKQDLAEAKKKRNAAALSQAKLERKIQRSESKINMLKDSDKLANAREILDDDTDYEDLAAQKEQAESDLEETLIRIQTLDDKKPRKKQSIYLEDAEERQKLEQLKVELEFQQKNDHALVVEFDPKDCVDPECPYCHQFVPDEHRLAVSAEYHKRQDQLKKINNKLDYSKQYDTYLADYNSARTYQNSLREMLEKELDELTEELSHQVSDKERQAAQELVEGFDNTQKQLPKDRTTLNQLNQNIAKYDGRIESLENQIETYQNQVKDKPDPESVIEASRLIEQHDAAVVDHKVALDCFKESKKNRNNLRKTLEQLKLKLKQKAKIQGLLDTISEAGEVFHWNQLPKTVSQANLELLVDDINENLATFNNPFYVEADEDLTFKVFFPGKSPVKAKQLSGGQQVVLAIAFRSALDRVFGHDVGMMFLDEPTAGLDSDNVAYFHDALQHLAQKMHGNRQLGVITHIQDLGGVFDQLIEI